MKTVTALIRQILGHSVAKSSLIVLTGSMVANFFAYLYHLIVGRILGPVRYGELAALLALFYLFNVLSLGIQTVLTKYFSNFKAHQDNGKAKGLYVVATKWMLVVELAGFLILTLFLDTLTLFFNISDRMNLIWLYLIFSSYFISVVQLSIYQGFQMFFIQNVLVNVGSILRVATGVAGALFGVGATLIANIFTNITMYLVGFIPLQSILRVKSSPVQLNTRNFVGYSIPAFITTFGLTALYSQDVLLVKHFFPPKEAGIYSSLAVLGKVIFYASSALGFVLFPVVAERKELRRGHKKIVWLALATVAGISLLLTTFYFLFPKLVVDLLFGKAFYEAIPYVGYFGLFITFYSLSSLLFSVNLAAENTRVWLFAAIGAVAQTILIWMYHTTLLNIIFVNLALSAGLFFLLLLYYSYAKEPS